MIDRTSDATIAAAYLISQRSHRPADLRDATIADATPVAAGRGGLDENRERASMRI